MAHVRSDDRLTFDLKTSSRFQMMTREVALLGRRHQSDLSEGFPGSDKTFVHCE
jgi:hypothetical protein